MAEESSRPAFQSIESLVHAFGSVSFMLESTFNAIYSSFRAVLAVAENFGRLRTMFGQVYSTFAVMRILQWLYKKLLYLIGKCMRTHATHTHTDCKMSIN
jgi:peroxin-13